MDETDEEWETRTPEDEKRLRRNSLRRSKARQKRAWDLACRRASSQAMAVKSTTASSAPSTPSMAFPTTLIGGGLYVIDWDAVLVPARKPVEETVVDSAELPPSTTEPVVAASVTEPVVTGGEVRPSLQKTVIDGQVVLMRDGKVVQNVEDLFDYSDPTPYDPSDYISSPGHEMRVWFAKKYERDEDLAAEIGAYQQQKSELSP